MAFVLISSNAVWIALRIADHTPTISDRLFGTPRFLTPRSGDNAVPLEGEPQIANPRVSRSRPELQLIVDQV